MNFLLAMVAKHTTMLKNQAKVLREIKAVLFYGKDVKGKGKVDG